jgi:DNA-binding NtrC family response regulator
MISATLDCDRLTELSETGIGREERSSLFIGSNSVGKSDDEPGSREMSSASDDITGDLMCAAGSDVTVLITAEDPTERRRYARIIHERSSRGHEAFTAVSCSGNQEDGPMTGELQRWIEGSPAGTVFLDEVDRLSPQMQTQLLSILEGDAGRDRTAGELFRRPVRLIAGVSRPLSADVVADKFSLVLYYRLNVIHIQVPVDGSLADAPTGSRLM